jgi:hypothetical protein
MPRESLPWASSFPTLKAVLLRLRRLARLRGVINMTYTEIIVRELTLTLGTLAKLELGQYVGHLANLEFWSEEV